MRVSENFHTKLEWQIRELIDGDDPFSGDLLCVKFNCPEGKHSTHSLLVELFAEQGKKWQTSLEERKALLESISLKVTKVQNRQSLKPRYTVLLFHCTAE